MTGTIIAPGTDNSLSCPSGFVIDYDGEIESFTIGLLGACNLPSEFQIDGIRVVLMALLLKPLKLKTYVLTFSNLRTLIFLKGYKLFVFKNDLKSKIL